LWWHINTSLTRKKAVLNETPNHEDVWRTGGITPLILKLGIRCRRGAVFRVRVILRPTVSRPVCFGIKPPSWAYDQIFITVRPLRVCWDGAPSLTRGWVCLLQLLLSLPAQSFSGPSLARLMITFYCLRFETPPNWRTRSLYLYPPGTEWDRLYPQALGLNRCVPSTHFLLSANNVEIRSITSWRPYLSRLSPIVDTLYIRYTAIQFYPLSFEFDEETGLTWCMGPRRSMLLLNSQDVSLLEDLQRSFQADES
jgi:hypothetical protein